LHGEHFDAKRSDHLAVASLTSFSFKVSNPASDVSGAVLTREELSFGGGALVPRQFSRMIEELALGVVTFVRVRYVPAIKETLIFISFLFVC